HPYAFSGFCVGGSYGLLPYKNRRTLDEVKSATGEGFAAIKQGLEPLGENERRGPEYLGNHTGDEPDQARLASGHEGRFGFLHAVDS
ncbi:15515_t:CDS:2, partial [Funneliformis caledonium]